MTNKDSAALILRLAAFYWVVTGTIELIASAVSLTIPTSADVAWIHQPIFSTLTLIITAAYPIAGVLVLFLADKLAARWCKEHDSPAPAWMTFTTGAALLGIYFSVQGFRDVAGAIFHFQAIFHRSGNGGSSYFLAEPFVKAAVYLAAGLLLLAKPQWLKSKFDSDTAKANDSVSK